MEETSLSKFGFTHVKSQLNMGRNGGGGRCGGICMKLFEQACLILCLCRSLSLCECVVVRV